MGWFYAPGCTRPSGTESASDHPTHPTLPDTPAEFANGQAIYQANCSSCHDSSRDGAPRLGFGPAWKRRTAQGETSLVENAIEGLDLMPPRGGNEELTNDEMGEAVRYMIYRAELGIPEKH